MPTRISAGVDHCPFNLLFITMMIPINSKITNFSLYSVYLYKQKEKKQGW